MVTYISKLSVFALVSLHAANAAYASNSSPAATPTPVATEPQSAVAPESETTPSSSFSSRWTPYVMLRADFTQPRLDEKLPAREVATQSALLDFNVTGKTEFSSYFRLQADIDLFARRSWNYQKRNLLTRGIETSQSGTEENPSYRLALNEIYSNGEFQNGYQYTVGKKRIVWGTGFAANPTDLLNPTKNPLDPTYERRGAWLVQAENIQEKQALAVFLSPGVLENKNTIPTDVGTYADADGKRRSHYLAGLRYYHLLGGADINVMLFRSERFKDEMSESWRAGASWSQYLTAISKQLEVHAEVLTQHGSVRPTATGESRLNSRDREFKTLLGLRYDFDNESSLVIEYLNQTDGDTIADLQTRLQNYQLLLSRYASFSDLSLPVIVMRNMLYVNYQRYKFNEDTFLSWALAHNLHDHSGYQGPILQWTPNQTLALTLSANTDYNLKRNSGVLVTGLGRRRTNELNPIKSRVGFEVKSFF